MSSVRLSPFEMIIKRIMDVVIASIGLIITMPIMIVVAIIIWIEDHGPIMIFQERVGIDFNTFTLLKFRTMVVEAEDINNYGSSSNHINDTILKNPTDPRFTWVGKFLRRWSIDELPQLWNIMSGEMILVGPRPEETRIVRLYNNEQRHRLSMKPGLTGPMQVSERGALDMEARLALELEYINNYSILKDVMILLKTFLR